MLKFCFALWLTLFCTLISSPYAYSREGRESYEHLRREYAPQGSPESSFRLELQLMLQGIYCYDLPLFDPDWRKKGREIIYSSAYRQTAQSFSVPFRANIERHYAVIYFPDNPNLGPVFLYLDRSGWVIDRTSVLNNIRYDSSNTRWFAAEGDYPYLDILRKVFTMEKMQLDSGSWAYKIK
jgi:hypothetical protein